MSLLAVVASVCLILVSLAVWALRAAKKQPKAQSSPPSKTAATAEPTPSRTKTPPPPPPSSSMQQKPSEHLRSLRWLPNEDDIFGLAATHDGAVLAVVDVACGARIFRAPAEQPKKRKPRPHGEDFADVLTPAGKRTTGCALRRCGDASVVFAVAVESPARCYVYECGAAAAAAEHPSLLHSVDLAQSVEHVALLAACAAEPVLATGTLRQGATAMQLWNARSGAPLRAALDSKRIRNNGIAVSPDGTLLAVATHLQDVPIFVLQRSMGVARASDALGHKSCVLRVSIGGKASSESSSSWLLAAASEDGTAKLWRIAEFADKGSGHEMLWSAELAAPASGVIGVAVAPDESFVAIAFDKKVVLHSCADGSIRHVLPFGHGIVVSLAWLAPATLAIATTRSCALWNESF